MTNSPLDVSPEVLADADLKIHAKAARFEAEGRIPAGTAAGMEPRSAEQFAEILQHMHDER